MKRFIATLSIAGVVLVASASGASAGSPTCGDTLGLKNHGTHVLTYVNAVDGSGAAGGKPAHHGAAVGPGASFCLPQAQSS